MFNDLLQQIESTSTLDFTIATTRIVQYVDTCDDYIHILEQIGTIPENIEFDSTEEKLFSKASDAVLSRAFRELGLKSIVLSERGDSADVQAESYYHGYTLVADAKAFRMSRTAKNQKDFKVTALSGWRKDADYAVLCCPYYQYPTNTSQIFAQAVDHNVCLLSWEHLVFLIQNGIKETETVDLSTIWNVSGEYAKHCVVSEKKKCFIHVINDAVVQVTNLACNSFSKFLSIAQTHIILRSYEEIDFWNNEIEKIKQYTKEQAISELIKAKKINEKITQIKKYVAGFKS